MRKKGSNAKNLRKLEPQPEQTFLIKKISVTRKHEIKLNQLLVISVPKSKKFGYLEIWIDCCHGTQALLRAD